MSWFGVSWRSLEVRSTVMALPPGLSYDGPLIETANGGDSDWVEIKKIRAYTNAFVILEDDNTKKVLLGLKKRGFGVGIWNGFGGKVDPGETPLQAAHRELKEEAGINAPLEHCGVLLFVLDGLEAAFDIHVFRAHEYSGTITESEEMRPQWFSVPADLLPLSNPSAIDSSPNLPPMPLKQMWADDQFWLPQMFARRYFVGRADFVGNDMVKWWFGAAPSSCMSPPGPSL